MRELLFHKIYKFSLPEYVLDYYLVAIYYYAPIIIIIFQEEESSASGVSALNLINVGGIFLVLLIGLVLGIFMAAIEKFWNAWKKKKLFN